VRFGIGLISILLAAFFVALVPALLAGLLSTVFEDQLASGAEPAVVYQSEGEAGEPLFTDRQLPGAGPREVDPNVTRFVTPAAPPVGAPEPPPLGGASPYRLTVRQPREGQTVRSNGGRLAVAVDVTPSLGAGHRLEIFLDGQRTGSLGGAGEEHVLENVARGPHVVWAAVTGEDGETLAESGRARFHLQRVSRLTRPPGPDVPGGAVLDPG
jgi:hypothetical protein